MRSRDRVFLIVTGLALLAPPRPAASQVSDRAGVDRLGWLAGCWEQRRGGRITIEMWMRPAGGLMLGANRTVAEGTARQWEHLELRVDGDHLVFTARPSGQPRASFRSTRVTDSSFTVENLQHDFPQRLIYRRVGPDSLVARIEGPGTAGWRGVDFPMQRVACVPDANR